MNSPERFKGKIILSKEPVMSDAFFNMIIEKLKEKDAITTIPNGSVELDYMKNCEYDAEPILTDDFFVTTETDFGGSEGIYMDVYLEKEEKDRTIRRRIGTVKTLSETWDDLEWMSVLAVRIRKAASEVRRENILRFIQKGYCIVEPKDKETDKEVYNEADLRLKPGVVYCTDKAEQLIDALKSSESAHLIDFSSRTDVTEQYRKKE